MQNPCWSHSYTSLVQEALGEKAGNRCVCAPALKVPLVFEHLLWLPLMVLKTTEENVCFYFKMCRLHVEEEEAKDNPENGFA